MNASSASNMEVNTSNSQSTHGFRSNTRNPPRFSAHQRPPSSSRFSPYSSKRSYTSKKLVVEKIPDDFCTIECVNDYFRTFGAIVNIQVQVGERRAVIEFSQHDEARRAHSCPDAAFGNRFVKIFWVKEEEGSGNGGARSFHGARELEKNSFNPNVVGFDLGADENASAPSKFEDSTTSLPTSRLELTVEEKIRLAEQTKEIRSNIVRQLKELEMKQQESRNELIGRMGQISSEDKMEILAGLKKVSHTIASTRVPPLIDDRSLTSTQHSLHHHATAATEPSYSASPSSFFTSQRHMAMSNQEVCSSVRALISHSCFYFN